MQRIIAYLVVIRTSSDTTKVTIVKGITYLEEHQIEGCSCSTDDKMWRRKVHCVLSRNTMSRIV